MSSRFIILGVPRSGTSMVAGLFAEAGLFAGEDLLRPTVSNPRGYFESARINQVNNYLISQIVKWPWPFERLRNRLDFQLNRDVRSFAFSSPWRLGRAHTDEIEGELTTLLSRASFCYKDPRLCVTLPTWRQFMPSDTGFVVVFREPSKTIQSYIKNGRDVYDPPLIPCRDELSVAYARNYARLMKWAKPDWLFIHYDEVLTDHGLERLARWSGMKLTPQTLDSSLIRSTSTARSEASTAAWSVYEKLCRRAEYGRPHERRQSA